MTDAVIFIVGLITSILVIDWLCDLRNEDEDQ